jgi:hypothetical protein
MKKYIVLLPLLMSLIGLTQKLSNPASFAKSIVADDLKKHLYIIAGKEMEGRETATEGQKKAAAYIENHFRSLGLLPGNNGSYQMNFSVYQDSLSSAAIEVDGKSFEINTDFQVNIGLNHTAMLMGSEIVYVGKGQSDTARDDYAGINARGKIVLVIPGSSPGTGGRNRFNQNAIQEAAQKNGAAAILVVQNNFPRKNANKKGNQYLYAFRKNIYPNTFYISENIARAIMKEDYDVAKAGEMKPKTYSNEVKLDFSKTTSSVQSSNVIGYIEGTDKKDEYVFITAHYDHLGKKDTVIFYGADDDGSGTVGVLELAEAFAKAKAAGKGPRRSVVFMTVSGEEKGLWGSEYYSNHPLFPLDKTSVDLNIDMIGRIDPSRKQGDSTNYVYVIGDDKISTDLKQINEAMNNKYVKLELDYKFNDPNDPNFFYYRSDHYNFAKKGVPIIFYFNGTHRDYHQKTDTPDKINYNLLAKRAQLVFYTAWEMANRNDMLKRDIPLDHSLFIR